MLALMHKELLLITSTHELDNANIYKTVIG